MNRNWQLAGATLLLAAFTLPQGATAHPHSPHGKYHRHDHEVTVIQRSRRHHTPRWLAPKQTRPHHHSQDRLRWVRPGILYLPRKRAAVGHLLILPDGRSGWVAGFGDRRVTLRVNGEFLSFAYRFED